MPELERLEQQHWSFTGLHGIESTTIQAIDATFCSHPNAELIARHNHAQSLVTLLADAGYRTDFFGTWPRLYRDMEEWSRDLGFQKYHGLEEIQADPVDRNAVIGEFLPDRRLFTRVIRDLNTTPHEKRFITILTCDTHIPTGRIDYGPVSYTEAPEWMKSQPLSSLLRSFHRLDQDLRWMVTELETSGILNEDTLLVLTADHCCPPMHGIGDIPGYNPDLHGTIPLVMISKRSLPPAVRPMASQLDLAPSLLHLTGIPVPQGAWGRSLFDPTAPESTFASFDQRTVQIRTTAGEERIFERSEAVSPEDRQLVRLMSVLYREPLPNRKHTALK